MFVVVVVATGASNTVHGQAYTVLAARGSPAAAQLTAGSTNSNALLLSSDALSDPSQMGLHSLVHSLHPVPAQLLAQDHLNSWFKSLDVSSWTLKGIAVPPWPRVQGSVTSYFVATVDTPNEDSDRGWGFGRALSGPY